MEVPNYGNGFNTKKDIFYPLIVFGEIEYLTFIQICTANYKKKCRTCFLFHEGGYLVPFS